MTLVCGYSSCVSQNETDVCYKAYQVKAGMTATIYAGANTSAPVVDTLNAGAHFARQSAQNYPGCSISPSLRPSRNGFVWGYAHVGGKSGWVDATLLQVDDSLTVCGPAAADFNCGHNPANGGRCSPQQVCDGGPQSGVLDSRAFTVVAATLNLRYAPASTPFDLLISGDTVQSLCRSGVYNCVSITTAKYASSANGWILVDSSTVS